MLSQHALHVVSQHALQQGGSAPGGGCLVPGGPGGDPPKMTRTTTGGKLRGIRSKPIAKGEIEGIRSRPIAKGKLKGIRSRPIAKGEIEGDQIQAHSQGGELRGSDPGAQPRGKLRGVRSDLPPNCYCCRQYASYWNAFLSLCCFSLESEAEAESDIFSVFRFLSFLIFQPVSIFQDLPDNLIY